MDRKMNRTRIPDIAVLCLLSLTQAAYAATTLVDDFADYPDIVSSYWLPKTGGEHVKASARLAGEGTNRMFVMDISFGEKAVKNDAVVISKAMTINAATALSIAGNLSAQGIVARAGITDARKQVHYAVLKRYDHGGPAVHTLTLNDFSSPDTIDFPLEGVLLEFTKDTKTKGETAASITLRELRISAPELSVKERLSLEIIPRIASGVAYAGEEALYDVIIRSRDGSAWPDLNLVIDSQRDDGTSNRFMRDITIAGGERRIETFMFKEPIGHTTFRALLLQGATPLVRSISALAVIARRDTPRSTANVFNIHYDKLDPEASKRLGSAYDRVFLRGYATDAVPIIASATNSTPRMISIMPSVALETWIKKNPKADIKTYRDRYLPELLSRVNQYLPSRRSEVAAIEVINEPDIYFWHRTKLSLEDAADLYADFIRPVYVEVKRLDPSVPVVALGVSARDILSATSGAPIPGFPGDLSFSRAVFSRTAGHIDIFGGHPYTHNRTFVPGKRAAPFPDEMQFRERCLLPPVELMKATGMKPRWWAGEIGWTISGSLDLTGDHYRNHAIATAQTLIFVKTVPAMEYITWAYFYWMEPDTGIRYSLFSTPYDEDGRDRRNAPCRFPIPGASAFAAASRQLEGADNGREIDLGEKICAWRFNNGTSGNSVVTIWSRRDVDYTLSPKNPPAGEIMNMYGRTTGDLKTSPVHLDRSPTYVVSAIKDGDILEASIKGASIKPMRPLTVRNAWMPTSADLNLEIDHYGDAALPVVITLDGERIKSVLEPQKLQLLRLSPKDGHGPLSVTVSWEGGSVPVTISRERLRLPFIAQPTIDGVLDELQSTPPIALNRKSDIFQPENSWTGPLDLSVKAWAGWNESGFYFAADVTDNAHTVESSADAATFWRYDSIQLVLDTGSDSRNEMDTNDRELGLALINNELKVFCSGLPKDLRKKKFSPPAAGKRESGHTVYETFIPWASLGIEPPASGRIFGMNFIVNENDGRGRAHWMGLTPGIGEGRKPELYKRFILESR